MNTEHAHQHHGASLSQHTNQILAEKLEGAGTLLAQDDAPGESEVIGEIVTPDNLVS